MSGTPSGSSLRAGGGRKRGASPLEHGKTLKPTSGKPGKASKQTTLDPDGRAKKDKGGTSKVRKKSGLPGRGGLESSESTQSVDAHSAPSADGRTNPLLSAVVLRRSTPAQPTTLVRGNRTLVSLNLTRNEIGYAGMTALLDTVLPLSRDPQPADPLQPGLLRISVHNNYVLGLGGSAAGAPGLSRRRRSTTTMAGGGLVDRAAAGPSQTDADATARYLNAAMATRDPMLRTQTTTTKPAALSSTYVNVLDV